MGKSKGGKYGYKGGRRGPPRANDEDGSEEGSDEEVQQRGGQSANVGLMPPSDSEEEAEGEEKPAKPPAQSRNVGEMPPSESEDDDDDDGDSDDSDPTPEYLRAGPPRKKEPEPVVKTEEEVRKDLERLELIRKKREEDRAKRIATEGWDRFAPVSDTNRPPGHVPADHPSKDKH